MFSAILDGASNVVESTKTWASQPFTSSMDAKGWALFLLMVIVVTGFWLMILKEITTEL